MKENPEDPIDKGLLDYDNFSIKAYANPDGSAVLTPVVDVVDEQEAYYLGEEITYEVTIANDSDYDATDVTVADSLNAIGDQGKGVSIEAGESTAIQFTYTVTEDDVKNGKLVNKIEITNKEGDVWDVACTVKTADAATDEVTDDNDKAAGDGAGSGTDTGDTSNMTPFMIIMILSAAAIAAIFVITFRRKRRNA